MKLWTRVSHKMVFLVLQRPKIAAENDGQNDGQSLDFIFVNFSLEVIKSLKFRERVKKVKSIFMKSCHVIRKNDFLKITCKK